MALDVEQRLHELRTAEEALRAQSAQLQKAREALVAERQRYLELFDFAPVAYGVTDSGGVLGEANQALAALLAEPQGTLVGKPLIAYVDERDRREFRHRLLLLARGEPQRWKLRVRPRSGGSVWAEAIAARAQTGAAIGDLRWVLRDVSETKRVEAELEQRADRGAAEVEEARALLEAVLRQLPTGVVIVDRALRVLLANDQARAILGGALEDGGLLLDSLAERSARPDGSLYRREDLPLARALVDGEVVEHELVQYDPAGDGSPLVLEVAAAAVRSEAGDAVAAVSVLADVTERERNDRAMKEFVTNAAHELQTPIAAIVSAVDVLQAGAKSRARDRNRFLGHIEEQASRLARLVRTLLLLARTQSGLERPRLEVVRLRPLLQDVADATHTSRRVTTEIDCPPELGALANVELLEQALLNLAANAVHHTERGRITVEAVERDDGVVAVGVRDTGSGIARDELERVFDRFRRSDASRGFGLGLAIVREIATALGGEVEIESEPGVGTAVRLVLPGVRFPTA